MDFDEYTIKKLVNEVTIAAISRMLSEENVLRERQMSWDRYRGYVEEEVSRRFEEIRAIR